MHLAHNYFRAVRQRRDMWGSDPMSESAFRQDLHGFAIELRKLAYTMPAGHEDRLIHLSERMVQRARQSGVRTSDTA